MNVRIKTASDALVDDTVTVTAPSRMDERVVASLGADDKATASLGADDGATVPLRANDAINMVKEERPLDPRGCNLRPPVGATAVEDASMASQGHRHVAPCLPPARGENTCLSQLSVIRPEPTHGNSFAQTCDTGHPGPPRGAKDAALLDGTPVKCEKGQEVIRGLTYRTPGVFSSRWTGAMCLQLQRGTASVR